MNKIFYSLITLTIALFFLMLGILSLMFPWSPTVRIELIQFILEDSMTIFLIGLGFVVVALALIINISLNARTTYYRLRSGPYSVWINESIIQDYLSSYLENLFPQSQIPNRLTLKKNKIHLVADLPYVPPSEQKDVLEKIRSDLSDLFASFLGYRDSFFLTASFQNERLDEKKQQKYPSKNSKVVLGRFKAP